MDAVYKVLESDIDLLAAALLEVKVAVAVKDMKEDVLERGGQIIEYTPNSVRIRGLSYSRKLYEFRVFSR